MTSHAEEFMDTAAAEAGTRAPLAFDIVEGVGDGTTVVEASAGTGKTYAIVDIAARHIAEGVAIDELLLVTFSRSATAELRERMRSRLWRLAEALSPAATTDTEADPGTDPLLRMLLTGDPADVASRRDRLTRALSDFDASTIATTHTFCNRMLEALGFLGERELIYEIVEDVDDLVEDAARDLYFQGFVRDAEEPVFGLDDAIVIAKDAVRNPGVALAPSDPAGENADADDRIAARRVRFCSRVREIVNERKLLARVRTYDDLQMILYSIVTDTHVGDDACARIRDAFGLVLVDEFQDTDPFQWEILRRCFHRQKPLVLVGDPKQSIYAFRGAEVLSYLDAVAVADERRALENNWRTDGDLVTALYRVYGGANLGSSQITVYPVESAHPGSRLRGPGATPLRVRWFDVDDFPVRGRSGFAPVSAIRDAVIGDVAADITRLLSSGTELTVDGHTRPVHPGDIAILVVANKTIEPLQRALAGHGVGSVVGTGTSVFSTMSARHWLWLIRAIESPSRTDRVALAAMTPLIGWTPDDLADASDDARTELAAQLSDLAKVFDIGGFAALVQRVLGDRRVAARVLATADGERALTDLMQVATVCNRHVVENDCGLSSVQEWLADRIKDVSRWRRSDEQTRRLDRDTHVVQIMTVHASKGLAFPIVYVPFGWDGARVPSPKTFRFHDENQTRFLDVGGPDTTGRSERLRRSMSEESGEDLRKLYVALTRAASQVVMWWAPSQGTSHSALHRLVFGRTPGYLAVGTDIPETVPVPDPAECAARLTQLGAGTSSISVERAVGADPGRWESGTDGAEPAELSAAIFGGKIDTSWQRTSYSAIIAGAAHGPAAETPDAGSEPEAEVTVDEPAVPGDVAEVVDTETGGAADEAGMSLMNGMPFGAAFGTFVHEVLEYVDTAAPDRHTHVRDLCSRSAARYALSVDAESLTTALDAVLTTPLGFGDLWSIPPRDRLAELDFELPLGDADGAAALSEIAGLMARMLPDDDQLRDYADILGALPARTLRGFLTGSIDSVLRTPQGRFVIVDYKTNRLRPGDLHATDFSTPAMAGEMIRSHYPLQALLYSVALHRYLRWRLPGYHPAEHLGPVQYHFVRGMIGPDTPLGCGVFEWNVPTELIISLSDLLSGSGCDTRGARSAGDRARGVES
ncbi:UvrD-helicase domain-containing protein [Gordonia sp. NPDC003950]